MTAERPRGASRLPVVSVVMIFKDARPFLEEAAQSVLAQSWPALELLLVDDGGEDGSAAIAAAVQRGHPDRVRLLAHPGRVNRGTGPSRLLGVHGARGELVAFLDADDRWDPEHLEGEVELLQRSAPARLVCGRAWTWRSWDDRSAVDVLSPLPFAPGRRVEPPRLLEATLRNGAVATPTCSLLVDRQLLAACARDVSAFPSTYEDQVLNTLLQLHVPAVVSGATSAWYRQHPGSLSAEARRSGFDRTSGASDSRRAFVEWLAARPELAEPACASLRPLVARALLEQVAPLRSSARPVRLLRRLAAATPWGRHRRRRELDAEFLQRWGHHLEGSVAVVGRRRDLPRTVRALVRPGVVRSWPPVWSGPPAECTVVLGGLAELRDPAVAVAALRARTAPGGALLACLTGAAALDPTSPVRRALAHAFGECQLTVEVHGVAPLGARVRAVVPC